MTHRDPRAPLASSGAIKFVTAFVHDDVLYEPGTFLTCNDDQDQGVIDVLREEGARGGVAFVRVDSVRASSSPDLGGDDFDLLRPPAVVTLTGPLSDALCSGVALMAALLKMTLWALGRRLIVRREIGPLRVAQQAANRGLA